MTSSSSYVITNWDLQIRVRDAKSPKFKKEVYVRCTVGTRELFKTSTETTSISLSEAIAIPRACWEPDSEPFQIYDYCPLRDGLIRFSVFSDGDLIGHSELSSPTTTTASLTPITIPFASGPHGHVSLEVLYSETHITKLLPLSIKGNNKGNKFICACDGNSLLFFKEKHCPPPAACAELEIDLSKAQVLVGSMTSSTKKPPIFTLEINNDEHFELQPETIQDASWWSEQLFSRASTVKSAPIPDTTKKQKEKNKPNNHNQQCKLFGISFEEMSALAKSSENGVPLPIEMLFSHIETHLDEGIYRLGSSPSEVESLLSKIDTIETNPDLLSKVNVHTAVGALKAILKRTTSPLLPKEARQIAQNGNFVGGLSEEIRSELKLSITKMPNTSKSVLQRLLKHLQFLCVPSNEAITKMKSQAFAVVFGPILLPPVDIDSMSFDSPAITIGFAEALIRSADNLFQNEQPKIETNKKETEEEAAAAAVNSHHHHRHHSKTHRKDEKVTSHHHRHHSKSHSTQSILEKVRNVKDQAKKLFRKYDKLNCGKITVEVLMKFIEDLNQTSFKIPSEEQKKIIDSLAEDGKIGYSKFKNWWISYYEKIATAPTPNEILPTPEKQQEQEEITPSVSPGLDSKVNNQEQDEGNSSDSDSGDELPIGDIIPSLDQTTSMTNETQTTAEAKQEEIPTIEIENAIQVEETVEIKEVNTKEEEERKHKEEIPTIEIEQKQEIHIETEEETTITTKEEIQHQVPTTETQSLPTLEISLEETKSDQSS